LRPLLTLLEELMVLVLILHIHVRPTYLEGPSR
jgi:hypothetical protein